MPSLVPLGRYKVEYANGTTKEIRTNFGAIMELEELLPGDDSPSATTLLTGIWLCLGKPKGDVKKWASDVVDVVPIEPPAADPSPPKAGAA